MGTTNRDFSLNFRGFERDDPGTVERFSQFCQANFLLSRETASSLSSSPHTIVLTHGGSLDELEALATVLREIGALVDVSESELEAHPLITTLSTAHDLRRIFNDDRPTGTTEGREEGATYQAQAAAVPPPLGSALYLLTSRTDVLAERRALRQQARLGTLHNPSLKSSSPTRSGMPLRLTYLYTALAALLILPLIVVKWDSPTLPLLETFQPRIPSLTHHASSQLNEGRARTLSGTAEQKGLRVEIKTVLSNSALSISSLMMLPIITRGIGITAPQNFVQVARIEGEPAFLRQDSPGLWIGVTSLSLFLKDGDNTPTLSVPATVTIAIKDIGGEALATIALQQQVQDQNSADKAHEIQVERTAAGTYTIVGAYSISVPLS